MKLKRFIPIKHRSKAVFVSDKQILRHVAKLATILVTLILAHAFAMVTLEGLSFWQGLWLTLTTLTTVGYGDLSAQTVAGQVATVLMMYLSAITLLTFLISDYVDYRIARNYRIRTGHWNWNMEQHILIINSPKYNGEQFFMRLVAQIRVDQEYQQTPILLLNPDFHDGLPEPLREMGVVHTTGRGSVASDLAQGNPQTAKHIMVLAGDEYNTDSDSLSFDIVYRLHEQHMTHKVLVECVDDGNRKRFSQLGVKSILRPIRSYPEILVRALDAPGSEIVIEDMFTRRDDHPERYSIWLEGERWADVVSAMVQAGVGTPMAFIEKDGNVTVHPNGDDTVCAQSLIIVVKSDDVPTQEEVDDAFQQYFSRLLTRQPTA